MKFNRAKMDKMRNAIARNAKMKLSADDESVESPMNEGMEQSLGKEPEYQPKMAPRNNYKGKTQGQRRC